ncbi:RNAse P Rpr2/Rpp21/SNM1 subunit domain-containing protein [Phycomyces nitens]|nr:RNAse P Rpr2/Rpp21/SNM1 subunit domain-containing protein [Phycomyces nitens]
MAKKKQGIQGANQQHLQAYQRMNYLNQAATLMSTIIIPIHNQPTILKNKKWHSNKSINTLHPLGQYYNTTMKKIGRRLVFRLDPSIKRNVCKQCDSTLVPALTSSVHVTSRPETAVITTCKVCGTTKEFLAREKHSLFSERPENIVNRVNPNKEQLINN